MKVRIIVALAFCIYFVSLFGGFVWDDQRFLQFDPNLGKPSALLNTWMEPYFTRQEGLYRPAVKFSYYLNGFLTGYQQWGFHLGNILLYSWLCVLVYKFLGVLKIKGAFWWTLLFTVLPIHTESVCNIVNRTDVMSLLFLLMAILFFKDKKWEFSGLTFLLAMLSKEVAVVGLVVLGFLAIREKISKSEKQTAITLYLIALSTYGLFRLNVLGIDSFAKGVVGFVENPLHFVPAGIRVVNAFSILIIGLAKTVVPWHLLFDYSFNQIPLVYDWWNIQVILGVMILVASIASFLTPLRKSVVWVLGMMFVWGPLLITGNFLFPSAGIFAERWYFWPSLGLLMLLSHVPGKVWPKWLVIVIFLFYTGRTMLRNFDWLSSDRLLLHDAKIMKNNFKARWAAVGVYIVDKDWPKAKEMLIEAENIYNKDSRLFLSWGNYYKGTGETNLAKINYQKCLDIDPNNFVCKNGLEALK